MIILIDNHMQIKLTFLFILQIHLTYIFFKYELMITLFLTQLACSLITSM